MAVANHPIQYTHPQNNPTIIFILTEYMIDCFIGFYLKTSRNVRIKNNFQNIGRKL
jgi:hypothetical protein